MSTDERARLEFARRMDDPRFLVAAIDALPDPDAAMVQRGAGATNVRTGWQTNAMC